MGDRYEDEYEDFLSDPIEGIGGKSIKELKALSVVSPSMLGTEGSAVFDRSVLRGNEPSAGEVRLWKNTTNIIVRETLKNLSPADRQAVETRESSDFALVPRDTDDIFFDLADPDSVYFEAFSEATRKVNEQNPFSDNRAATGAYGGQDALNAILNPLTLEQELENRELNREDLKAFDTVAEVTTYFAENPNVEFAIVGNEFAINKNYNPAATTEPVDEPSDDATVDQTEPPVVITETSFDPDTYELLVQPEPDPVVEAKPEREVFPSGREKRSSKQARKDWMREYGNKYFNDGSKRYVSPRPTEEGEPQRLWDSLWGSTHDFETGFPLIEVGN